MTLRMKAISDMLDMLGQYRKPQGYDQKLYLRLCDLGREIITEAWETKDPGNDLYNQHDSYAYAVFYRGEMLTMEFLPDVRSEGMSDPYEGHPEGITGRQAASEYMEVVRDKLPKSAGLILVCVNGMFYSRTQEASSDKKHKHHVLLQTQVMMELFTSKVKGSYVKTYM